MVRILLTILCLVFTLTPALSHNGEAPPPRPTAGKIPDSGGGPATPGGVGAPTARSDRVGPTPNLLGEHIRWVTWWSRNSASALDLAALRTSKRQGGPETRSSPHPFGTGGEKNRRLGDDSDPLAPIVDALLRAVRDPDPDVSTSAIIALGKTRSPRGVPVLLDLLGPDATGRRTVVVSAILALGMAGRGEEDARQFLLQALEDTRKAWRERAYAAAALGCMREARAIPLLCRCARSDDDHVEVRAVSILGLGMIGDEIVLPEIAAFLTLERFRRAKYAPLRAFAAIALERLGSPGAVRHLVAAVDDERREVRQQVVLSLGRLATSEDSAARRALGRVLTSESDKILLAHAAMALGEIGHPGDAERLRAFAAKDDSMTGPYGLLGLAVLLREAADAELSERHLPWLRARLRTESKAETRGALAITLGVAGGPEDGALLTAIVGSRLSVWTRANSALALGYLPPGEEARSALRNAVRPEEHHAVRRAAAISLGLFGDGEAAEILITQLRTGRTEHTRASAALCLGHLLDPRDAAPLIEALDSRKSPDSVRNLAAVALGMIAEREDPIVRMADHTSPFLRSAILAEFASLY